MVCFYPEGSIFISMSTIFSSLFSNDFRINCYSVCSEYVQMEVSYFCELLFPFMLSAFFQMIYVIPFSLMTHIGLCLKCCGSEIKLCFEDPDLRIFAKVTTLAFPNLVALQ